MEHDKWIRRLWDRDETVLGEIIAACGPLCRKIAGNILPSPEDAEEVTADTWLQVWNSIPPNRPDSIAAYAARITRNLAVNRYHRNHAACRNSDVLTDWEALTENPDLFETVTHGDPVAQQTEAAELEKAVEAFLRTLAKEERVLFVRRFYFLENTDSLAALLGITPHHVHVKLSRLRGKLRRYLERRHFL